MDRGRVLLSIRSVVASFRSALGHGAEVDASRERARHLLDQVAIEIRGVRDPELHQLLADAREQVESALR